MTIYNVIYKSEECLPEAGAVEDWQQRGKQEL